MEPRKVFHTREYRLPGTSFTISGYSRSRYRTGFYINGLELALDAGIQYFKKVSTYLITHGHTDHTANLQHSLLEFDIKSSPEEERPVIYVPESLADHIDRKIRSSFESNYCSHSPAIQKRIDKYYSLVGLVSGDAVGCTVNKQKLLIQTWRGHHSVPTLLYGIYFLKNKLKQEYQDLEQADLKKLAKAGTKLTEQRQIPFLSYLLDTSITAIAQQPEMLDFPTVIVECTFLLDDEKEMAERKKHIHWNSLLPYVKSRPDTQFILVHFSMRYKDEEIQEFFREQIRTHELENVRPWLTDIEFSLDDVDDADDAQDIPSESNKLTIARLAEEYELMNSDIGTPILPIFVIGALFGALANWLWTCVS